jgi:hypothetical protein
MTVFTGKTNFTSYDGNARTLAKAAPMSLFPAHDSSDAIMETMKEVLLNTCKYNISVLQDSIDYLDAGDSETVYYDYGSRPTSEAINGISIALTTGIWDASHTGVSEDAAIAMCIDGMRALNECYIKAPYWNHIRQSAMYAGSMGRAAWMLWNYMTDAQQTATLATVLAEANRIVALAVEYCDLEGKDTDGETLAWDSTVLRVAHNLCANHPSAQTWRNHLIKLELSCLATPSDTTSETVIEGQKVCDWVDGFNACDDGRLFNHGVVHPDYYACIIYYIQESKTSANIRYGLGCTGSFDFNCEKFWQYLTSHDHDTETYLSPGGTVYAQDGWYEIYYPGGSVWSINSELQDQFMLLDCCAHREGWDSLVSTTALDWIASRVARIKVMQERHTDLHTYATGEFPNCPAREQESCARIADAYLTYRGAA